METLGWIVLLIVCLFTIVPSFIKYVLNVIGQFSGYSCCPNCGNSWFWTSHGVIDYNDESGVMICSKCLAHPKRLETWRISNALKDWGWSEEKIHAVRKAVLEYR